MADKPFLYMGQPSDEIPRDVTCVRVNPYIKVITEKAFHDCNQLTTVNLREGLDYIGDSAFSGYKSVFDDR
jgi:hypothetical protein